MKYIVPSDFCELDSDVKSAVLVSAENALRDLDQVYFQDKHFTNFDELKSYLGEKCKAVEAENDWPGERLDN